MGAQERFEVKRRIDRRALGDKFRRESLPSLNRTRLRSRNHQLSAIKSHLNYPVLAAIAREKRPSVVRHADNNAATLRRLHDVTEAKR